MNIQYFSEMSLCTDPGCTYETNSCMAGRGVYKTLMRFLAIPMIPTLERGAGADLGILRGGGSGPKFFKGGGVGSRSAGIFIYCQAKKKPGGGVKLPTPPPPDPAMGSDSIPYEPLLRCIYICTQLY